MSRAATGARCCAVIVADAAAADELAVTLPAARPTEYAVHAAFRYIDSESGLVIHRALGRILHTQNKALEFEYEVQWCAFFVDTRVARVKAL